MIVEIREIPEEGKHIAGEITRDIFELDPKDAQPDGPVRFDFFVSIVSDSLLVQGKLEAGFRMNCVRCLDSYRQLVKLPDCIFTEPVENQASIDLTDSIREDILLALPIHPHCEDGDPPRNCPQLGQFEEPEGSAEAEATDEPEKPDPWAGLDGFEPERD